MENKMLVTQALDERDLLVKKINDKINKASFVDTIKKNEEKVMGKHILKNDFMEQAKSSYQQIIDLIARFQKLDEAIITSNANTFVQTSYGQISVASAISIRNRLRENSTYGLSADFEMNLCLSMDEEYAGKLQIANQKNRDLEQTAEEMRLSILGRDNKVKDTKPLEVVDVYIKENTTEIVDVLNVRKKVEELTEKRRKLMSELDTQIKVSNATTFVEIS